VFCVIAGERQQLNMNNVQLAALQQGLNDLNSDLKNVSDRMQAEIARVSYDTNQQLAELSQSVSAMHAKLFDATATADAGANKAVEHRHQRVRVDTDHIAVLARNEVLDTVFSFVGIGEYYYVAGVCRNWRGRYMTLCSQIEGNKSSRLNTCRASIVMTAARLQLALDNGLTCEKLVQHSWLLAYAVAEQSIEPVPVLTLARVYGLQWTYDFTSAAAEVKRYDLLKWLHKCGCTLDLDLIREDAYDSDDLEHMKQLYTITGPWPADHLTDMLWDSGCYNDLDTAKWCREQGAAWPTSFYHHFVSEIEEINRSTSDCWTLRCVQWAIANGSTWRTWRCQDVAPQLYRCKSDDTEHSDDTCNSNCHRKNAIEVFRWAHQNGCPYTCNEAAAAVAVAAHA
jgi:hypothetical protein